MATELMKRGNREVWPFPGFGRFFDDMITHWPANSTRAMRPAMDVSEDEDKITIKTELPGIPKAEVSRVFDEFFRATNAGSMEKEGTGLGLSLVKQVIERHGGIVSVSSKEGSGSEFQFTLPLAGEQTHGL